MDVRFSKIRYSESDQNVELEWDETKGTDVVHSSLKSPAAPEPEFIVALQAFKPELLNVLELKRAYGENLEVYQVGITYRNGRRAIVITAKKKVAEANSPFVIHSPYLPEPDEGFSAKGMSSQMIELLNRLEQLAELYREGHRAQQELSLNTTTNGGNPEQHQQADIEDSDTSGSENDVEKQAPIVLPRLGSKLRLIGDKKRTYRVTKVSSERVTVESGTLPAQVARLDSLKWDNEQKVWLAEFLYDPDTAVTEHREAAAEMPV